MPSVTITTRQQVELNAVVTLASTGGQYKPPPALIAGQGPINALAGLPIWTTDSPTKHTLVASADGQSCLVKPGTATGSGVVTCTVPKGDGTSITGTHTVVVVADNPDTVTLSAGTPSPLL